MIVGSNPTSAFFFLLFFGIDKINFLLKGVGDGYILGIVGETDNNMYFFLCMEFIFCLI